MIPQRLENYDQVLPVIVHLQDGALVSSAIAYSRAGSKGGPLLIWVNATPLLYSYITGGRSSLPFHFIQILFENLMFSLVQFLLTTPPKVCVGKNNSALVRRSLHYIYML